jgi:hypothetical protein
MWNRAESNSNTVPLAIEAMEQRRMMSVTASVPDAPERGLLLPYIEQDNLYSLRSTQTLKVDPNNPNSPIEQKVRTTRIMDEEGIFYF